jgi:hypothetical protein
MVDDYEALVRVWPDAQPSLSVQEVLIRLIEAVPAKFNAKHLRTIQRTVKAWRGQIAHKLVLDAFATRLDSPATAAAREAPMTVGLTSDPT